MASLLSHPHTSGSIDVKMIDVHQAADFFGNFYICIFRRPRWFLKRDRGADGVLVTDHIEG